MDVLMGAEADAVDAVEDALEPGHAGVHVPPPGLELYRRRPEGWRLRSELARRSAAQREESSSAARRTARAAAASRSSRAASS
jgi:hypothetical protein